MNDTDDFTQLQRRLSAVITKSEWTTSKMRMQKTGDELRDRRAKKHRTANEFLQKLFEQRLDSGLIDDHRIGDRYRNYVKNRTNLDDDEGNSIDELDRRLNGLDRKRNENSFKFDQSNLNTTLDGSFHVDLNEYSADGLLNDENIDEFSLKSSTNENRKKPSRILPTLNPIVQVTSTPNDTIDEILDQTFRDEDENEERSFDEFSEIHQQSSKNSVKTLPIEENRISFASIIRPVALRADGSEYRFVTPPKDEENRNFSLKIEPWKFSSFPRSLTSRTKKFPLNKGKRQLPSAPSEESKTNSIEQFGKEEIFNLLDNLDSNSDEKNSSKTFVTILDQLKLVNVETLSSSLFFTETNSFEDFSTVDEKENFLGKIFQNSISSQEERFYKKFVVSLNDPTSLTVYTMTVSTVQFSSSIFLPYSILNGRRPLLKNSTETNFKPIRSKGNKHVCHVTALESPLDKSSLQQNDIILQINDQSVVEWTTEQIIKLITQYRKRSNKLSLTIARLCQPSFR